MKTIDIFKEVMQDGMEIVKCKELSNKYKITLSYNGMSATCELEKLCTPGNERSLCMRAIDTAMSTMYIDNGNYQEAKAWLDGERWEKHDTTDISNSMELVIREKIKEYIMELNQETERCVSWIEEHMDGDSCQVSAMEMRAKTLGEVVNDLESRLEELV